MRDPVGEAIAAIKAGDKGRGRDLLLDVLKTDRANERAWLWLSATVDGDDQMRFCLEQVLAINPANEMAKKGLARLEGKDVRPQEMAAQQVEAVAPRAPVEPVVEVARPQPQVEAAVPAEPMGQAVEAASPQIVGVTLLVLLIVWAVWWVQRPSAVMELMKVG